MKCYQNLNQAFLKWWEQFFTTVLWALGIDSCQTQLTLTGKGFFACHKIRRNTQNETAYFWLQCTLTSCTHLAPRVTVGCVLWPPGARGLQIFMSASVVTMLFSQRVALYQCWLVSQHGTGIRNCFARKLTIYQLMVAAGSVSIVNEMLPKLEPSLLEMMRTVFHDGLMSSWLWFLPNSAHSDGQGLSCMPQDSSEYTEWDCTLLIAMHFVLLHPFCTQSHRGVGIVASWC